MAGEWFARPPFPDARPPSRSVPAPPPMLSLHPRLSASPAFACARLRYGPSGECDHEWFRPDADRAGGFDVRDAHMLVLDDECTAATVGEAVEVELVIEPGAGGGMVELAHVLAPGSFVHASDSLDLPIADREGPSGPRRMRLRLGDAPVRINARLTGGARLTVRLTA